MELTTEQWLLTAWLGGFSVWAFALFGYDKWQAKRGGRRISEGSLWLISAFGGWLGGLLGMLVFRHKPAKLSFVFMFVAAFVIWFTLVRAVWQARG